MIRVLAAGAYRETDVVTETIRSGRRPSSRVSRAVDAGWTHATAQMTRAGRAFHDGPLVRFEGATIGERLRVRVSPSITYRDVIGLRAAPMRAADIARVHRPNPMSVLTAMTTTDGQLALGWRTTGDWRPGFEVSGGFVRRGEQLFTAARNRLDEDFGECARGLESLELIALYECDEILETVALFVAASRCAASAVAASSAYPRTRLSPACDRCWPPHLHRPSATALRLYWDMRCA